MMLPLIVGLYRTASQTGTIEGIEFFGRSGFCVQLTISSLQRPFYDLDLLESTHNASTEHRTSFGDPQLTIEQQRSTVAE